jgi:hypothetical protein
MYYSNDIKPPYLPQRGQQPSTQRNVLWRLDSEVQISTFIGSMTMSKLQEDHDTPLYQCILSFRTNTLFIKMQCEISNDFSLDIISVNISRFVSIMRLELNVQVP